jgi:hypothetical protein
MKLRVICAALYLAVPLSACRSREAHETPAAKATGALPAGTPHVRIWVSQAGAIELDGKPAELAAVKAAIAELVTRKGTVVFGRESAEQKPHQRGLEVIAVIAESRLPILMSTRRDFADVLPPPR